MAQTKGQNFQDVNQAALPVLGQVARTTNEAIMSAIDTSFDSPLRMYAAATPDAKVYIKAQQILATDGAGKSVPPSENNIPSFVDSTVDFQTQATTGGTFDITWPASTVGQFRRVGFTLLTTGTMTALFSAEAASVGALANPGTLFVSGGIPAGWIDLECTNVLGYFKTAGSSTSVIENSVGGTARIVRFGSGGGGGGLGEKTQVSSRGYADGSSTQNCAISTVSNKTRMVISGWTFTVDVNSGKTEGDAQVEINGQAVERMVSGLNDVAGNRVYDEVDDHTVDVYEVTSGGTSALNSDDLVSAKRTFYAATQVDAINSSVIPGTDNAYDLGSATKRWRHGYFGPDSVFIGDGRIRRNSTTGSLEYRKDDASPYGPLGGGGGAGTDLLATLTSDELGNYVALAPNTFEDDYNNASAKATLSNTVQSASALRLVVGQISGTATRTRVTGDTFTKIDGISVRSQQLCAPKNTAFLNDGTTSVTAYFAGDLTNLFAASAKVMVLTELADNDTGADGERRYISLKNSAGKVARLVATASYSAGTDTTSLVITNPDSLTLQMGIANESINQYVRVVPFGTKFEVKATSGGTYEELEIDSLAMYSPASLRLPGENFFVETGALTGTCFKFDVQMSTNRQFGVAQVLMKTASSSTFYWFWSADYGKSWTQFSTSKDATYGYGEEAAGYFQYVNAQQIFVANNGKMVSTYTKVVSGHQQAWAVIANLTDPTPAISDIVAGNQGTLGLVYGNTSTDYGAIVAGDPIDLSFIAFAVACYDNASGKVIWYTAGGTSYMGTSANYPQQYSVANTITVIGSGSSHRTIWNYYRVSDGYVSSVYWDQPSTSSVGASVIIGENAVPVSIKQLNNRAIMTYMKQSDSTMKLITGTINGTPSWGSPVILSLLAGSAFYGWNTGDIYKNPFRILNRTLVQNPADEKHVFVTADLNHPDGVARSTLFEITDVTAYLGVQISQYTDTLGHGLISSSTYQAVGQTFTASGTRVRSVAVKGYQVGTIGSGYTMWAELYATDGTKPTGTAIATSINTYDPSKITKSTSSQWLHFNFPTQTLTGVYALVIKTNAPVSGSNYISLRSSIGSSYGGGNWVWFDGASWSSGSDDQVFEINGEYVTDLSASASATDVQTAYHSTASPFGINIHSQESQIELIDSSTIQWITRRTPINSDAYRPIAGHPFRRTISIGSGGVKSTVSDAKIAGYAPSNYDPNLIFASLLGHPNSASINPTTGVRVTGYRAEDRSGLCTTAADIATASGTTDSDFISSVWNPSGYCVYFNGTSDHLYYAAAGEHMQLDSSKDFLVEMQIKWGGLTAGEQTLCGKWNSTGSNGWRINLAPTTGKVILQLVGTNYTVSTNPIPQAFRYFRMKYTASTRLASFWLSTDGISYTEMAYDTQNQCPAATSYGSTFYFTIGMERSSGTSWYKGYIGYVKVLRDSLTPVYFGFRNQESLISIQNLGTRIAVKQMDGTNDTTLANNFNNPGIISGDISQAAVVDSRDMILKFAHSLAVQGEYMALRETMGRASDRDQSSEQGYAVQFQK